MIKSIDKTHQTLQELLIQFVQLLLLLLPY